MPLEYVILSYQIFSWFFFCYRKDLLLFMKLPEMAMLELWKSCWRAMTALTRKEKWVKDYFCVLCN